jgi:hypothetical protein
MVLQEVLVANSQIPALDDGFEECSGEPGEQGCGLQPDCGR